MNKQKGENNFYYVFFVVIIIIIILVYLSTLGKVNLVSHQSSHKNRLNWIEDRIFNLKKSSQSKIQLKSELDLKVKKYFQYTRIILVGLYFGFCYFIYIQLNFDFFDKLFFILNITQVLGIVVLSILFIRFDKPSDFKDILRIIHLSIKSIVYENYKNLDDEVKLINKEIGILEQEIMKLQSSNIENVVKD